MARKLASIQKIIDIFPIENADQIERVTILGWQVVVRKGEFKVGDEVVFCEVDSLLPADQPWAKFMEPRNFRVKTIKLRQTLSQGLVFPRSILPQNFTKWQEDDDVTEILDIKKWEFKPHDGGAKMGKAQGNFPYLVPKTDEDRVQSYPKKLIALQGLPYYITTKMDGTSSTFLYMKGEFVACSRNFMKKDDEENIYWFVARKYNLMEKLKDTPFAIQGEIMAPKLQGNRLNLTEPDLFVFNIHDTEKQRPLSYWDYIQFCGDNKLNIAPVEEWGDSFNYDIPQLLEKAKGKYVGTENLREGIVVRSQDYVNEKFSRISFKVLNNDFLLNE